ncbi:MAG: hypothetical protein V4510_09040 [bacterium]
MTRKFRQLGNQAPHGAKKKQVTMKHFVIAALVVGGVWLLLPHQATPPKAAASTHDPGCSITDPLHSVQRIVGDTQGCIAELRNGLPGVAGTGQTVYIRFDGTAWTETGTTIQNPAAKTDAAKVYSSGAVALQVSIHDSSGTVLFTTSASRGSAALMQVDYTDASAAGVTIEDSERGTYEVPLV